MLFNHEKEKIHEEFIHLNKNERVKEKMYVRAYAAKSQPLTISTESEECRRDMITSKS